MSSSFPCSCFSAATAGASRRQAGHHGAQNQNRTSFPAIEANSNGCPSSCPPSSNKISARVSTGAAAAAVVVAGACAAAAVVPVSPAAVVGAAAASVEVSAAVAAGSGDDVSSSLPQPARTPTPINPATSAVAARYCSCRTSPSLSLVCEARARVTFGPVSTRALLVTALVTGVVILVAFTIRVLIWL